MGSTNSSFLGPPGMGGAKHHRGGRHGAVGGAMRASLNLV